MKEHCTSQYEGPGVGARLVWSRNRKRTYTGRGREAQVGEMSRKIIRDVTEGQITHGPTGHCGHVSLHSM